MAKINCYSQLIVKDLNEAYFLPYTISSYHKDAKFHNDKKYLVFDRRRDMKTVTIRTVLIFSGKQGAAPPSRIVPVRL